MNLKASESEHSFSGILVRQKGGLAGHFISIPQEIASVFTEQKVKRTIGTLNGVGFRLSPLSDGSGGRYLAIGNQLRKSARIVEGSSVHVKIKPDPNPDFIDLCEEFAAVLELDEEAGKIYFNFTKGMQRSLAYYANSAKQSETRIKRALDLAHKFKTGQLYFQKAKKNPPKTEDETD